MNAITASEKRQQLGQFLTSESMATFMASLFERSPRDLTFWTPALALECFPARSCGSSAARSRSPDELLSRPTSWIRR